MRALLFVVTVSLWVLLVFFVAAIAAGVLRGFLGV